MRRKRSSSMWACALFQHPAKNANKLVEEKEPLTDWVRFFKAESREEYLINEGMEVGIEKGIEQGIEALILDNLESGVSKEIIIEKLEKRFRLTEEQARRHYDKYGK